MAGAPGYRWDGGRCRLYFQTKPDMWGNVKGKELANLGSRRSSALSRGFRPARSALRRPDDPLSARPGTPMNAGPRHPQPAGDLRLPQPARGEHPPGLLPSGLEAALSITFRDPDHSIDEFRFLTIGPGSTGRILMVAHPDRGEAVRLISARPATRSERRFYEEG